MHITDFRPEWDLTYSKVRPSPLPSAALAPLKPPQLSYTIVVLSGTCYPLAKLSVLYLYTPLYQQRAFASVCYVAVACIVVSSSAVTLISLFGCTPIHGGWDRSVPAKCVDTALFFYVYTLRVACTDVLLMALPIPVLMRMQQQRCVTVGLGVIFASGLL